MAKVASGIWSLNEVYGAMKDSIWPGSAVVFNADYLLVAGGGGAGGDLGGGGGADVMSLNGPQGGVLGDGVVGEEAQAGGRDR